MDCLPREKSHPQGLATLSMAYSPLNPWRPLSAPNAHGLLPPKLCSSSMIREWFPTDVPLWRFPTKLVQLGTDASAVLAHRRSRPPLAPGILLRVGGVCFLGLFDLLGAPSASNGSEVSLFESPLSSLSLTSSCELISAGP
jgi:hypothetical protein